MKNSLTPSWDSFSIGLRTLCNGDYDRPIQFDIYDWDNDSDNDLIGKEFFRSMFLPFSSTHLSLSTVSKNDHSDLLHLRRKDMHSSVSMFCYFTSKP